MFWLVLAAGGTAPDLSALVKREVDLVSCRSTDSAVVVVCGSKRSSNRYRTVDPAAEFDVHGNVMSVMRERSRWIEGMETGIHSCSAVGPGGYTGCMLRQWERNDLQNPERK